MNHRTLLPTLAALGAAGLTACSDAPPGVAPGSTQSTVFAPTAGGPLTGDADLPSLRGLVIEDPNQGGQASSFQLADVYYGRLVELWGKGPRGVDVRVARDFLIGEAVLGDGVKTRLVTHGVLGTSRYMIDEDVTDHAPGGGRARFLRLAGAAADAAATLADASLDGTGLSSMVPRNASFALRFNDLVDPASVTSGAVALLVGSPWLTPFEARIVPDTVFGGVDQASGGFASTRVIVDVTVDEIEQQRSSTAVATNLKGLPEGRGAEPTAAFRIPTVAGAAGLVASTGGTPLGVSPGSIDYASATRDIVRPFRVGSGGSENRGFMMDVDPPRLVARAEVDLTSAPVQQSAADVFILPRIQFASPGCAGPAQVGDIVTQAIGVVAEVISSPGTQTGDGLDNVRVRLLEFPAGWTGPEQWETDGAGAAVYSAPYDATMDSLRVACLVEVFPAPLGFPSAPTRGVRTDATFALRFNEPVDQVGNRDVEGVLIGRSPIDASGPFDPRDAVVAEAQAFVPSGTDAVYAQKPLVPLSHVNGTSEVFYITARTGFSALQDLAGNPLVESPGPIAMSIDPAEDTVTSAGVLLPVTTLNDLGNAGTDFSGQIIRDFTQEALRPRPVVRFQGNVDRSQPVLAQQTAFTQGVRTPHTPFGAKMQTVWRYCDMGFGLTDPNTINIDVERLYWAPAFGSATADTYAEYEIKLSHSRFAPDEVVDPASLFPQFQNSGLRSLYSNNVQGAQEVVHRRALGYQFGPGDIVQSPTQQALMPFPMNRVTGEPTRTFTWRDTDLRSRAGFSSAGVEPWAYLNALGVPIPSQSYYRVSQVQSLGLPLLLDVAVWPSPGAVGFTGWELNLAANSSSRPFFRAFSAGGVNTSGSTVLVDPDTETNANGGFSPGSTPPGRPTFGRDNSVMLGAADFVVRKSVAHTLWVDTGSDAPTRVFADVLLATSGSGASGVSATVRGALDIEYDNSAGILDNDADENGVADMLEDASKLDLYGDYYNEDDLGSLTHNAVGQNPGVTFVAGSGELDDWRLSVNEISGARYVQVRLAFESDIATGEESVARAVGIAWRE